MNRLLQYLIVFSLSFASQALSAQPAIFKNSILNIPQGAAMINGEPTYYNDIQLLSDIEGNFTLVAAEQSNLVAVDSVVVSITGLFSVQVSLTVTGNKSVPCVDLQTPAIFRNDSVFKVALAETTLGSAETCIAVLDPFETTIVLDVQGLSSGDYTVNVNGVEASFSL
ncbi:MAG: hypothetical protein COA96_07015 [SAR86 cluster bacterium]|uniref:Uncharacterized protein n=1 Tax=SAR86 cluster bacterium TaxID=2030880 RepID=A0A2A5B3C0_9GAMM|nr:MAG: hypothetical protein COA96_07015 [SAR86 cluster bacterium]